MNVSRSCTIEKTRSYDQMMKPCPAILMVTDVHNALTTRWLICPDDNPGCYSLSHKTSHHQISWSLETRDTGTTKSGLSDIWQASRQQCCRGAGQISERYDHFITHYYGDNTSFCDEPALSRSELEPLDLASSTFVTSRLKVMSYWLMADKTS